MSRRISTIEDVVTGQLCTGCGICSFVEPERYEMRDTLNFGRRPFAKTEASKENGRAIMACPGKHLEHDYSTQSNAVNEDLKAGWGPVLDVWEGYAVDDEIRSAGSSGGAATALSLFAVEAGGADGVLHTKAKEDVPYLNETTYSQTRSQLVAATGSRYSPASPCDGLDKVISRDGYSVFVGKPCDVAAVQKARLLDPELDRKIGITIGFFCAGTPSTFGTLKLIEKAGIGNPGFVKKLRFRGNGWPGLWTATYDEENTSDKSAQMTYAESWGFLQSFRQWRCYICPDHTGEFADIAVGDPWYREIQLGEKGKSLIVARTDKGKEFLLRAEKAGYIKLETQDVNLLPESQPNLLKSRGSLWARLIVLRLFGASVPNFIGFKTGYYWWSELSLKNKVQSFYETSKRVFRKDLHRRIKIEPWNSDVKESSDD